MSKQQNWIPKSPIEAYATTYESLAKALGGLQNKFEVPEAAREFVKRSTAAAKDRSTGLRAGANNVTGAIEEALVGAVNGWPRPIARSPMRSIRTRRRLLLRSTSWRAHSH